MALIKINNNVSENIGAVPEGAYARLIGKDTGAVNLGTKTFWLEITRNKEQRESLSEFDKPRYIKVSLNDVWNLEIENDTLLGSIVTEAYRCLKVKYPEFTTDWEDDV